MRSHSIFPIVNKFLMLPNFQLPVGSYGRCRLLIVAFKLLKQEEMVHMLGTIYIQIVKKNKNTKTFEYENEYLNVGKKQRLSVLCVLHVCCNVRSTQPTR